MDCPRCKLPLRTVDYEDVETDMCDSCWGFWLDTGELEQILDVRQMQFDESEQKAILEVMTASQPGRQDPAPCPKCGQVMGRLHYDQSVHIVLDRCNDHGIWLDTGEIKKVQAVAEQSENIHRMLLQKLGLGR